MTRLLLCLLFASLAVLPDILNGQTFIPAQPYGDTKLVNDFLCSEMVYPEAAMEQKIEGKVVLVFMVDKDGTAGGIRVKEGLRPDMDQEAIRVFKLLQWKPAIRLGNPVPSEEEFTFKFSIKKYERHCKQRGYVKHDYPHQPVDTSLAVYELKQLDKPPEPIFTEKGMNLEKFIIQNLKYPEAAFKQNIFGKVVLSYVVETHGGPSNIIIEKPLGGGCTEEAIRILKLIRWMPGIKDGTAVRSRIPMNLTFKLPTESDTKVFDNNQGAL